MKTHLITINRLQPGQKCWSWLNVAYRITLSTHNCRLKDTVLVPACPFVSAAVCMPLTNSFMFQEGTLTVQSLTLPWSFYSWFQPPYILYCQPGPGLPCSWTQSPLDVRKEAGLLPVHAFLPIFPVASFGQILHSKWERQVKISSRGLANQVPYFLHC